MCGRFTLTTTDLGRVAEALDAELSDEHAALHRARYNIAPSDLCFIVEGEARRRLVPARWGLCSAESPWVINARAESLAMRPLFAEALARRRCVVPADGFYEWAGGRGDRRPTWFHSPSGQLLWMAGLWSARPDGELAFTVVTTPANALVAEVHDRMPVLLTVEAAGAWLAAPRSDLLVPAPPGALAAREVSSRVSSTANDDPQCLAPPDQLRLF
jgi:putative SOS response-associated peptidase YedK